MVQFTDDDTGKTVRTPDGATVGQVATVEEGTAYVETDPGIVESMKASLGWEDDREGTIAIEPDEVTEVTDDALSLSMSALRERAADESVVERDEGTDQRDSGAATGGSASGARTDDSSDDRHSEMGDAPPEGERTVTEKRGENEPARD